MGCTGKNQTLDIASRDLYAAPAEGTLGMHNINQNNVIEQALGILPIKQR
jgi:2-oxoglutarate dehydrogenase E1 component